MTATREHTATPTVERVAQARAEAAACSATAPARQPRRADRPTPLYLITSAAPTPGKDRSAPAF